MSSDNRPPEFREAESTELPKPAEQVYSKSVLKRLEAQKVILTVKELIEQLSKYDSDSPFIVCKVKENPNATGIIYQIKHLDESSNFIPTVRIHVS